jgi:signal transduction histidine kinase
MAAASSVEGGPHSNRIFGSAVILAILGVAEASAAVWFGLARGAVRGFEPYNGLSVGHDIAFALFLIVAAVIARRQPRNRYWVLLAAAGILNISFPAQYTAFAVSHARSLPAIPLAAWLTDWTPFVGGATAAPGLLLFPTGRLPSRRWRLVGAAIAVNVVLTFVVGAVTPGPVGSGPGSPDNPLGIVALQGLPLNVLGFGTVIATTALALIALASVVIRLRASRGDERQQLKWFLALVCLLPLSFGLSLVFYALNVQEPIINLLTAAMTTVSVAGFPVGIGIAIVKYRLYDIDVVISRTLVYGALAGFITAVYVGIVVGVGTLIGSGGRPNLALSIVATAVVAVGFQPVRERLKKLANRLVYGKRATPYEVLSEFSERVAQSYAGDDVLPRMARVLQEGTGAESATVWLRAADQLTPAASRPDTASGHDPLPIGDGTLPEIPGVSRAVAVRHQDELLGALTVTKRPGETLTPIEEKLLSDLAHQAGLVLKNVGLTADLQARLEELRASRQRLVAAQDDERRRLERNLHDGAQQNLVAIKVKLGLAEMMSAKDPEKARELISSLKTDTDEALETLRDLARGIYPPLLADKGLVAALESQARKATVPVTVEGDGVGRYPQEIEAAIYFCVLEALQNVQKYAAATGAAVRLSDVGGQLHFQVHDDGAGFDQGSVVKGAGLTNMDDRLDALGGDLSITSEVGRFTQVSGSIPIPAVEAAG